jgi:hypothetical protein
VERLDFLELALANVGPGMRVPQFLRDGSHHLDINRFGKPRQLFERLGSIPCLAWGLD